MFKRLLLGAALFTATTATAGEDPRMLVKYRIATMRSIGAHMGAGGLILKGKVNRSDDLLLHARAIRDMSLILPDLFPESTRPKSVKKTAALPAIWTKKKEFAKALKDFQKASEEMVRVLEKGDAKQYPDAQKALGMSCSSCHDSFKKDK